MLMVHKGLTASVTLCVWSLLLVSVPSSLASTPIYSYTDDSGTPTFTTDFESIPEKYRSHARPLELESSPLVPTSPPPALKIDEP
ncbi:MAG TPA: hypothetical protein VH681_02370, partial [Nitrospiraceae bacterium]